MGIFDRLFEKRGKKKDDLTVTPPTSQDQKRYSDAIRVISEAENLYQDNSGEGEPRWSDALVELAPQSIRAISARGWRKRGSAEPTNEFLIRVLGRIAKERSPQEKTLAIAVLQSALDMPDDNTIGLMNLKNGCVRELDELKALPGVDYSQAEASIDTKPFRLEPIYPSEIGSFKSPSPQEKPNLESAALWQLAHPRERREEEVVQKFEANYARWSKTFDSRSLSLVLCAYGFALEHLERYCEAVVAHRWACKIYPYKGFSSCDHLQEVESMAAKELEERRRNLKDKEEICEYCFRNIGEQEQPCVFRGRVACEECDNKLRGTSKAGTVDGRNSIITQEPAPSPAGRKVDMVPYVRDMISEIVGNMGADPWDREAEELAKEKSREIIGFGDVALNALIEIGMSFCDKLEGFRVAVDWKPPSYQENDAKGLKAILFVLSAFCDSNLLNRSKLAKNEQAIQLLMRVCELYSAIVRPILDKLGVSKRDLWRQLLLTLPIVERVYSSQRAMSLEGTLDYIEELILDRQKGLENPWGHISGDCFKIGCSYTHAHEVFRLADELFETGARQISDNF